MDWNGDTTVKTLFKLLLNVASAAVQIIVIALLMAYRRFNRDIRQDVESLFAGQSPEKEIIVTEQMLAGLPDPVRRYLTYTGVVGKPLVRTVRLKQKGVIRMGFEDPGRELEAKQYYSATEERPGFVWDATVRMGPLPVVRGRDMYADGKGYMLIKLGALVPVVDGRGEEMDQGAMVRYLSEMIWFPSAFLRENVSFEAIDDHSAKVTLADAGKTASGTMYFDDEGRFTDFVTRRYRAVGDTFELATWSTPVTEYGVLAGLNLPVRGKAVWKLPEGDLPYIDVTITEVEYNTPELY